MTNRLAIILGAVILIGIVTDILAFDGANLLFLGKKLYALLDWLAFWR